MRLKTPYLSTSQSNPPSFVAEIRTLLLTGRTSHTLRTRYTCTASPKRLHHDNTPPSFAGILYYALYQIDLFFLWFRHFKLIRASD